MDADQQHLETLITAFRDKGAPALIEPLATPSVLRIADADGKRVLHWAVELQDDPEVVKLVISRDPEVVVSLVGDERVWQWFDSQPAENFSSHDEIYNLLFDCYVAFVLHRFPDLIELCGTSNALEALVAAHEEDDLSLRVLCVRKSWDELLARIKKLPTQAAVSELFSLNEFGSTAFALAAVRKAPVEVLQSMLLLAELDSKKRNTLDIANIHLRRPLHATAEFHPDPAAIKILVRHHPPPCSPKTATADSSPRTASSSPTGAPLSCPSCASSPPPAAPPSPSAPRSSSASSTATSSCVSACAQRPSRSTPSSRLRS